MKTTIDLADELAVTLKTRAAQEGISLRAAVHEALRLWLKHRAPSDRPKPISREVGIMSGQGLSPEAAGRSWDDLRALSYDSKA
jgi:plasmid stability protein